MENEKIVIVGGGVIGCSTAYMLKLQNPKCRVLVLEQSSNPGQFCSFQNGGILNYGHNKAWRGSSILYKCMKNINNPLAHYKINSSLLFDFDFWLWAFRFFISSFSGLKDRDAQVFTLGKRTLELHSAFRSHLLQNRGKDFDDYLGDDIGLVHFYSKISDFQSSKAAALTLNAEYDVNFHIMSSRKSCTKYENGVLDWGKEIVGCIKNEKELFCGHDSFKLTKSLASMAESLGAVIQCDSVVASFTIKNNKVQCLTLTSGQVIIADRYVICTGATTRNVGKMLGWVPPIWPAKGFSFNLKTSKKFNHSLYMVDENPFYVTKLNDKYRISGSCEFCSLDDRFVDEARVTHLTDQAVSAFKITDAEVTDLWACQRPVTTDDLPIIGQYPGLENVYINAGHGSKGCIFSLASAELLAQILLKTSPILDPRPFSPDRFYI